MDIKLGTRINVFVWKESSIRNVPFGFQNTQNQTTKRCDERKEHVSSTSFYTGEDEIERNTVSIRCRLEISFCKRRSAAATL